jgi:hypothetical protein
VGLAGEGQVGEKRDGLAGVHLNWHAISLYARQTE